MSVLSKVVLTALAAGAMALPQQAAPSSYTNGTGTPPPARLPVLPPAAAADIARLIEPLKDATTAVARFNTLLGAVNGTVPATAAQENLVFDFNKLSNPARPPAGIGESPPILSTFPSCIFLTGH